MDLGVRYSGGAEGLQHECGPAAWPADVDIATGDVRDPGPETFQVVARTGAGPQPRARGPAAAADPEHVESAVGRQPVGLRREERLGGIAFEVDGAARPVLESFGKRTQWGDPDSCTDERQPCLGPRP